MLCTHELSVCRSRGHHLVAAIGVQFAHPQLVHAPRACMVHAHWVSKQFIDEARGRSAVRLQLTTGVECFVFQMV